MPEDLLGGPPRQDPELTRAAVAAVCAGDETAFCQLWDRIRPAVEVHLLGRVRGRVDPALRQRFDAETDDILQDVVLTLYKRARDFEYRGPGSLLAWVTQICDFVVNDWMDHWHSGKRNPKHERRLGTAAATDASTTPNLVNLLRDTAAGPSTSADRRESSRRVAQALETLDEREHRIVLLRYFGGADWSEVASSVGAASADAVRMECHTKIIPKLAGRLRTS